MMSLYEMIDRLFELLDGLANSGSMLSEEEAEENLLLKREYCGWYECEVSNTIEDLFNLFMG